MKPSSAKAKGRRLQQEVARDIVEAFDELQDDDVRSAIMGESGEDIKLSPLAQRLFPFSTETKNQERLNIWDALAQAEKNARGRTPLLVFRRNRSQLYVVLRWRTFLDLLRRLLPAR